MVRIISSLALGLVLALPLAASAGEAVEQQPLKIAGITPGETVVRAPVEDVASEKRETERPAQRRSEVRGSRTLDPGIRFNNPYAFPLQSLPIAVPQLTSFNF